MEPKPPDQFSDSDSSHHTWAERDYTYEEEEEEEDDHEEYAKDYGETPVSYGAGPCRVQVHSRPPVPNKQVNKGSGCLVFSGASKDPGVYQQWENNMERWLQTNNISEERKLTQAVSAFVGKAYAWWLKESTPTFYNKPILDWRSLKSRMRQEFVEKHQPHNILTQCRAAQKRVVSTSKPRPVSKEAAHMRKDQQKEVLKVKEEKTVSSSTTPPKSQDTATQGKSSNFVDSKEPTCYRCHKRGHFAAICPTRKLLETTSLGLESKTSKGDSLGDILTANSRLMHLSLPKSFDPGIRQEEGQEEFSTPSIEESHSQALTIFSQEISDNCDIQASKESNIIRLAKSITVSLSFPRSLPMILNSDVIHLFLAQNFENITGVKEIDRREVPTKKNRVISTRRHHHQQ